MKKFSSITRVNSHHTSRAKKIRGIVAGGVVAIALLFLVPKMIAAVAAMFMTPVHSFQTWIALSSDSFPQFFRDRTELLNEIADLKSAQSSQSGDKLTAQLLTRENEQLRGLLGSNGAKRILAGVIARPNKVPYDVLIIDKGSEDGIVEGAPVYIGNDAVIGIVVKDFPKSAVVELATTPGFTASVYIFGPNIYTDAEGVGGGQLRVQVPQGIELKEGDLVVLPGVDSGIYGAVQAVQTTPTQPEQYGYVSLPIPLASLRLVSVGDRALEPVTFEQAQSIVSKIKETVLKVPIPEHLLITTNALSASSTATSTAVGSSTKKNP